MGNDDNEYLPGALLNIQGTAEPEREASHDAISGLLSGYNGTTRPSVLAAVLPFLAKHEGVVRFMYCDTIGLVTTGIGNLIDPVDLALGVVWTAPDGSMATEEHVRSVWHFVKSHQDMRMGGGVAYWRLHGNDLRLDDAALSRLVCGRLVTNERLLKGRFPAFDDWPAPAQLAVHGMAWAMGPMFRFPAFVGAVNASPPNFEEAANESHMVNGAPRRNAAHRALLEQAAVVVRDGGNYEALTYVA